RRGPDGTLADPRWAASAVSLARRYSAPVVPIHLDGPASTLFHLFNRFSSELRDITLFHELLNKRGRAFTLTVGPTIAPDALDGEAAEVSAALKRYVEQTLPLGPDRPFA
ncbi:MAG: acyltransferase, partial [Phenylobacterium sp.]|uniref:GNAT family N-acetyltransferase n=1 Tax=Phenylobacterium sp. TaxID=1871053 RepID=UPI00277403DF|nr:acyltransferase [Phenylobacterium sp.]